MTIIRLCGQQLKLSAPVIAADTIDYIEMAVDMSEDWQRMDAVFVRFELDNYYVEAQVRDGRIRKEQHLNLTRGSWRVSAYGVRSSGEDIIERITSTTASLDVKVTGAHGGEPLPPDSQGVIEALKAQIAGKLDKQQSAEDAGKVLGIDEEGRVVPVEGGGGSAGEPGKPALIGSNGNWLIWDIERGEYVDSGKPSRGPNGAPGESITISSKTSNSGFEWVDGELVRTRPEWYTLNFSDGTSVDVESGYNGKDGENGTDGVDGLTPYIGENGNWWFPRPGWPTGIDTEKPSRGKPGTDGEPGESIRITNVHESGESGGLNIITFSDGTAVTIRNGKDGQGGGGEVQGAYCWANYGLMRDPVRPWQGWGHCTQYDRELDAFVMIVQSTTSNHNAEYPLHRTLIDPKSMAMSEYEEIRVNDADGAARTSGDGYFASFLILDTGEYIASDFNYSVYQSTDKGLTWDVICTLTEAKGLFGFIQMPSGRILAGTAEGVKFKVMYSDNKGSTWTSVEVGSNLGKQNFPDTSYNPFEPCFIDCGNGRIICYARASMNAMESFPAGAWSKNEPAVWSVSTDNGNSWSNWEWSDSIHHMSANNMQAQVIDGTAHVIYGNRSTSMVDEYGKHQYVTVYYNHAKLDDALTDTWSGEKLIYVLPEYNEESAMLADGGYPALLKDPIDNLYAIVYGADGSGTPYGANYHLLKGNPYQQTTVISDTSTSNRNVTYSQAQVEKMLADLKAWTIEQLLKIEGGGSIDTGNDGSFYVTDGLLYNFVFEDADADNLTWADRASNKSVVITAVDNDNKLVTPGAIREVVKSTAMPTKFTLEVINTGTTSNNIGQGQGMWNYGLALRDGTFATKGYQASLKANSAGHPISNKLGHYLITADAENGVYEMWINGEKYSTIEDPDGINLSTSYPEMPFCMWNVSTYSWRLYEKVLSDAEIANNYKYASRQVSLASFGVGDLVPNFNPVAR